MKRDLKINFYILEELTNEIKKYKSALDEMQQSSSNMVKMLRQNKSMAIKELEEMYTELTVEIKKSYEELQDLYTILSSYTNGMQSIIRPINKHSFLRVDRNDIYFNMQSIIAACTNVMLLVRNHGTVGLSNIASVIKSDEEKERERKNYNKLENIWQEVFPRYTRQLNTQIDALNKIHKNKIIPFENMDDEFNKKVRKLEGKYTNSWESMVKMHRQDLEDIWSFVKGAAIGLVDLVKGIYTLAKGIVCYVAAAEVISYIPPYCPKPKWASDTINDTNNMIVSILEDPGLVVEGLAQEISDTYEEEGAAYCTGYVVASFLGGKGLDKLSKAAKVKLFGGKTDDVLGAGDDVVKKAGVVAEAISVSKTSLATLRNAIKDGSILLKTADGRMFKPQKIAMAVDSTDPSNLLKRTYGFNRVWDSNPSIGDDIIEVAGKNAKEIAELYTENNLRTLYDNSFIDDLFAKYPEHFSELGVTKNEMITEMEKLRTMLRNAKAEAEAVPLPNKVIAPDGTASFEIGWSIENCAEVWAMRNAILSGIKIENIMLRTINYETGAFAELCQNCQRTFKSLIESGKIIKD